MLAVVLITVSLAVPTASSGALDIAPADGVGLSPTEPAVSPLGLPGPAPRRPTRRGIPAGFGALGGLAVVGGAAAASRRRRDDEPVYVLVHGYGGSPEDFGPLLERLGVDEADTVAFDYRTAAPGATSTEASRVAVAGAAARQLDALIRRLTVTHANVYSIHHSKGGAVGVSMIASLDDGSRPPIDGYRGAALLDPAIASGGLGDLQRWGRGSTAVPDNGGFDPVRCVDGECRDVRAHLGESSGVEVIAIRNPDALVTNFTDEPEHLRVYDLADDGDVSALAYMPWLPGVVGRVRSAHASVLDDQAVADCIAAEVARSGSCVWEGDGKRRRPTWGSGYNRNLMR